MNSSKVILKFERLLFNGIPDHPEHNWERDQNSNVSIRVTGRSRSTKSPVSIDSNTQVWGYFDLDFENETETFTPATPVSPLV